MALDVIFALLNACLGPLHTCSSIFVTNKISTEAQQYSTFQYLFSEVITTCYDEYDTRRHSASDHVIYIMSRTYVRRAKIIFDDGAKIELKISYYFRIGSVFVVKSAVQ